MTPGANYCGVFGCTNNSRTMPHLSYFSIPKNEERRRIWTALIGREDLLGKESRSKYYVCSTHFSNTMVTNKRLKPDAVPSMNLPGTAPCPSSSSICCLEPNVETEVDKPIIIKTQQVPGNLPTTTLHEIDGTERMLATGAQGSPVSQASPVVELMQEAEQFIKTVEKYPCLWEVNLPTYKCQDTKNAAWKEVVKQTSVPNVTTAKEKWKKLRDSFRESIKRRKESKSGTPVGIYKYYHVMKFLAPILENSSRTKDSEESDMESRPSSCFSEDALLPVSYDPEAAENETVTENQREGVKRTASEPAEDADPNAQKKQRLTEDDPMDKFFLAMSVNTKKLPHYLQLQVKRKVFNAVIEAEESDMWFNKFERSNSPGQQVFAAPLLQRSEETNFIKLERRSPDEGDSIEVKVESFEQITD